MRKKNNEKKNSENKTEEFKCNICNKNTHTTDICYKNPNNAKNINKADNSEKKPINILTKDENPLSESEFQQWMDSEN